LAKIERGAIKAPSVFTIARLAQVLGTSMDSLLGTETAPAAPETAKRGRSKSGISFIYFDINGCLVRFFHRAFTKLAHDTGATSDVIETTFWHYNDAVCRGEMPVDEFNRILAERLGVASLDWREYYMSTVDPIEEMEPLVNWVGQNYRFGLLSNIMPGFIDDMRGRGLIPRVQYDVIVDSSSEGVIKPEPRMYEIAQEKAGVPGNEILFIDDSRANLMAAEHLGWHVMWFDDFQPAESCAKIRAALEPADIVTSPVIGSSDF
jgi:FMN phosphatase YigB (HAD superfamily)